MVKQLIDIKAADDFCSRILGIYAMMRVDDIMKIWGHSISRSDANYAFPSLQLAAVNSLRIS